MVNCRSLLLLVIGTLVGVGIAWQANAFTGERYSKQAKISLEQARMIARKELPGGKIISEELEKEHGGSGLRYSFDVKQNGKVHEIGVDAKTGKVLENSLEGKEGKEGESKDKD